MGIDLGTCNTLVCVRNDGIVLNEPSVVAVRKNTNQVLNNGDAVGLVAREMLGKTPGSITAIRPLKDGVISDFEITEAMLSYFIRKVHGGGRLVRPRVVIAVPSGITAVERRAAAGRCDRGRPGRGCVPDLGGRSGLRSRRSDRAGPGGAGTGGCGRLRGADRCSERSGDLRLLRLRGRRRRHPGGDPRFS